MKKAKKVKQKSLIPVCVILIVVGILYIGGLYFLEWGTSPNDKKQGYQVCEITSGRLSTLSEELLDAGIIKNKAAFKIKALLSGVHGKFSKGKYELSPSMDADELIAVLQTGGIKEEKTTTVTIKEGLTIKEIADVLYDEGVIYDKNTFIDMCKTDNGTLKEGFLFPDTYEFYINSSAEQVISRMEARFDEIFTEEYVAKAKEYGWTTSDVIKMASIIEKESGKDDFKKVSQVLHNRLNTGMMLQVDATIRYATDNSGKSSTISITSEQYKSDSPYNSYKNHGLPPTAICNPSKNAIEAALYPDEEYTEYIYFCLVDYETGEMVFSKTYEEHLANVKKYKSNWQEYDAAIE